MTTRFSPLLAVAATLLTTGGSFAQESFTHTETLGNSTAKVSVAFHDDRETMVTCTPAQVAFAGARSVEKLKGLLPVLNARLMSRHGAAGTVIDVLLDAACYEDGFIGLGGYGKGVEKIQLAYEESTLDGEWGPPVRTPITEDSTE